MRGIDAELAVKLVIANTAHVFKDTTVGIGAVSAVTHPYERLDAQACQDVRRCCGG